jgi:hypothetical protein
VLKREEVSPSPNALRPPQYVHYGDRVRASPHPLTWPLPLEGERDIWRTGPELTAERQSPRGIQDKRLMPIYCGSPATEVVAGDDRWRQGGLELSPGA